MWILQSPEGDERYSFTFRLASPGHKTLGRAATADFVVDAPLVSRFHCRFALDADDDLTIEDLKSTNGILINDERLDRASLNHGDQIKIGRVLLLASRTGTSEPAANA